MVRQAISNRQRLPDRLSFIRQKYYLCFMSTFNIEILNPKAKKLLLDLADLRLISISESVSNPFLDVVKKIRSKKSNLSLEDITKEVEAVRSKRNGK
jgi:hypothetical protein